MGNCQITPDNTMLCQPVLATARGGALLKQWLQSEARKKKIEKNQNRERTSCVVSSGEQVHNSSLSLQMLSSLTCRYYRSTLKSHVCTFLCMNGVHNSFELVWNPLTWTSLSPKINRKSSPEALIQEGLSSPARNVLPRKGLSSMGAARSPSPLEILQPPAPELVPAATPRQRARCTSARL